MDVDRSLIDQASTLILGGAGGFVAAIVTFRTRLALADQREKQRSRQRAAEQERFAARLHEIDRRQLIVLQLLADIAKHLKLDKRFSDALVRFLAEDVTRRKEQIEEESTTDDGREHHD